MKIKVSSIIKFTIVIILIVVSAYYSVKDIKPEDLWNALRQANFLWVILSIPVILLSHWLRAMRWRIMLKPIVQGSSTLNLFKAVMIGYAANSVTPRGGELLRPFVYSRQEKVSFSSVFGTIVVERFIDLLTLLLIFLLALIIFSGKIIQALQNIFDKLNVDIKPSNFLYLSAIVLLVLIISFYPPIVDFFLRIIVKPFSKRIYDGINSKFHKFRIGFAIIKDPSAYLRLVLESVAIWICYGIPMYLMFFCFGFNNNMDLGAGDAFLLLVVVGVATTIAPTPGAIGVHHVAVRVAMVILYGITEKEALAYAVITHATNYIVQTLVGGFFYIRTKNLIPSRSKMDEEIENSPIENVMNSKKNVIT
ncbi:MAG: hypothetical protein QG635_1615 [Bacteroidota bacterium]|nr:hypothetical protein [Bacteroidota bacterium]